MKSLFKHLNNLNAHDQEDDDDSISSNINCKYYQIDELKKERNGKFSLLHLNIASLGAHKDEFEDKLSVLDLDFAILGLTVTRIIRSSIKRRDKLLMKFIKTKDEVLKDELYSTYKTLRNKIVSPTRAGKNLHFQKYFTENCEDIRKTWSGIRNVINP